MVRRIQRDSALRGALIAHRRRFAERWPTDSTRARLAAVATGEEVGTDSGELFSALFAVGNREAMRYARTNGPDRLFMLTEGDVLEEVPRGQT